MGRSFANQAPNNEAHPIHPTQELLGSALRGKRWSVTMGERFRRGFTATEKTELWDRWQCGGSLKAIGRAFGKPSSSIYCQVSPYGGIRPAPRRRSQLALTLSEREEISRGVAAHQSARSMARLLGRSASTVSRELSRNGGYDGYRAALADEKAWVRSRRPKRCKLANSQRLRQAAASKLRLNWAPEQIAGWLKRAHPEDECYRVSHETIYRSLFVQARGVLKKELLGHLRSKSLPPLLFLQPTRQRIARQAAICSACSLLLMRFVSVRDPSVTQRLVP
jgi:IS30 family transposase